MKVPDQASAYRFAIGAFNCVALYDGTNHYAADVFFANADPDELRRALADRHLEPTDIPSPYTCLLVQTERHRVLIDTGGRNLDPGVGLLRESLGSAGVEPADIDVVVLTHGHADHIGGNVDAAGRPAYPNARYVMARREWEFWTSASVLASAPAVFRLAAARNLPPIRGQIELIEGETEIVPGVLALPTPGHTPGHIAVALGSRVEELLYISDAFLHPIHLQHPDWHPVFDVDPTLALASKALLCDRAAANGSLVAAYHFDPFPGLGHITRHGRGWNWEPIPTVSADGKANAGSRTSG